MKTLKYLFISALICFSGQSCKNILEKAPLDIISDVAVWNDKAMTNSYVANLYGKMKLPSTFLPSLFPLDELPGDDIFIADDGSTPHTWHPEFNGNYIFGSLNSSGGFKEYWNYELIRACNVFIEKMATSTLSESIKTTLLAEVRVIRAYTYFEMVKRYGGVPLITKAQGINDPESELFAKRNKEAEIYDFIGSEIDAVLNALPVGDINRFTKYGALALKSRAMLYAGSIAKYGKVQLDGVAGIPSGRANSYYQASYDASKLIDGSGVFSLYKADIIPGDLKSYANNYYKLFITNKTPESIFEVSFIPGVRGNVAASFSYNLIGNMEFPGLDFANAFEMVDGSSGVIDYANIATTDVPGLHKNKDPRFNATFLGEGDIWNSVVVHTHFYIIKDNGNILGDRGVFYTGLNGVTLPGRGESDTWTGWCTKKMVKEYLKGPLILDGYMGTDDMPCLLFRLGEIYLNLAEAAQELGKSAEALKYTNLIRSRAGISQLSSISMKQIKQERRVELSMGEGHRWWDLRRWRDAAKSPAEGGLNGLRITKALPYYDFRDSKFHFETGNLESNPRVFKEAYYYLPITVARINNNKNLVENPGY
ncbi:MAG: RagB/SusD family nutrient uptake outer membrane protein [Bacteroidia bacterium]|nr:RagB/SusD family nutrient uptake outer membrane protein [Bacteroidia bacterium]